MDIRKYELRPVSFVALEVDQSDLGLRSEAKVDCRTVGNNVATC